MSIAVKNVLIPNQTIAKFVSSRDRLTSRVGNTDLLDLSDMLSACAAVAANIEVANKLTSGVVVTVLPDTANKYFDQRFWSEEDGAKN